MVGNKPGLVRSSYIIVPLTLCESLCRGVYRVAVSARATAGIVRVATPEYPTQAT